MHLFNDDFAMSIAEGKAVVDLVLSRGDFGGAGAGGGDDEVRLVDPVGVSVPHELDALEARRRLEERGLVVAPTGAPSPGQ